jgi:hypothetical protein
LLLFQKNGNVSVSGDLIVSGNLTISGNTTTLNTETLTIEDNKILLNSSVTGVPNADAGIEIERGSSTNVELRWNETTDKWQFTNDGFTYSDLGSGGGVTVSSNPPASPIEGQLWFDSDDGTTYIYYDSVFIEVGATAVDSLLSAIDAKGDLLVGTGDNTIARLGGGTNGQLLSANSSTATGLEWTTANYAPTVSPTFTGTVTLPSSTSIGSVTAAQIGHLSGVSSGIQTQLNAKASTGKAIAMSIVFGG